MPMQKGGKMKETIYKEDAIDVIVKCTNCNTPKDLREYVAEHSLWSLWSGGVLEALEAVEGLPSAPLYTEDEIQTMQDLEWSQMEKMYELGKEERKKGHWIYYDEFDGAVTHTCSECGKRMTTAIGVKASFCWNCGADMRGKKDD